MPVHRVVFPLVASLVLMTGCATTPTDPDVSNPFAVEAGEEAPDDWTPVADALHGVKIHTAFGDRYVGAWIDWSDSPSVKRLRLWQPTPEDRVTLDALVGEFKDRFRIDPAPYPRLDLDRWQKIAMQEAKRLRTGDDRSLGVGIDPRTGGLTIHLPEEPDGYRDALHARGIPSEAYVIHEGFSVWDAATET